MRIKMKLLISSLTLNIPAFPNAVPFILSNYIKDNMLDSTADNRETRDRHIGIRRQQGWTIS